jgi:hypothetical protein
VIEFEGVLQEGTCEGKPGRQAHPHPGRANATPLVALPRRARTGYPGGAQAAAFH